MIQKGIKGYILPLIAHVIWVVIVWPIDVLLDHMQAYFSKDKKPNYYLSDNFAPVAKEITAWDLQVTTGKIPSDLVGEFVRNGPNPLIVPKGGYHWFDGDGMLHGVRLHKDGKVSYVNRYTKTKAFLAELKSGHAIRLRVGELHGVVGLLKLLFNKLKIVVGLIPADLGSTANTALVFHNKKLQALLEVDVPYEIRMMYDGGFETAARLDYNGKLRNMTAHPKIDPETKELFYFGYGSLVKPWLKYGYIDATGEIKRTFDIDIPEPIMMHDFAITEHYAVFLDTSLVFHKEKIFSGKVYIFDKDHVSRIGIMDRYAKNQDGIVWFDIPACHVFHTANAWEEGDEVILCSCRSNNFDLYEIQVGRFEMVKWRCNMKTKIAKEEVICPGLFSEFPQVHPNLIGRKTKYAWSATKSGLRNLDGVIKLDLETNELLGIKFYGPKKFSGEACFVAKQNGTSEDDGYLLTFIHDMNTNQSSFVVLDAKNLEEIATVNLPQRVPFGFHGLFVSEEDILSQLNL